MSESIVNFPDGVSTISTAELARLHINSERWEWLLANMFFDIRQRYAAEKGGQPK